MTHGIAIRISRWSPGRWCWVAWMDGTRARGAQFPTRLLAWDAAMSWAVWVDKRNTGQSRPIQEVGS